MSQFLRNPKSWKVLIFLIILSLGIHSCKNDKNKTPYIPEIPVIEVIQQDVPIYQDFIGQIYGKYDIPIRARVTGFLDKIHFNEGSYVKKGQLLYTIDPKPFEAALAGQLSNLAEANTQLAKAESDLGRIVPLSKINAVSKSDLDAAQAQYDAAKANVEAVQSSVDIARIDLSYCNIKSPIKGLIGKTMAKVGEFVGQNPNPVILNTVSTIDTIHVEIYLVESDYLGLARRFVESERQKQQVDYIDEEARKERNLELILSDGSVFEYKGRVKFVDREVNPETGSLLIQTEFPNPNELLRPGQYAKVRARMNTIKNGLLVPQKCIMELQGTHSIFVVNDSNVVQSRQITTGPKYQGYWVVEKGLQPNEKVIFDGIQKVQPGMTIRPKETKFKNVAEQNQ